MSYLEKLKSEFPEKQPHEVLTKPTEAPFVSSVSNQTRHISENHPEVLRRVHEACHGLDITPGQFQALITEDDKTLIAAGSFSTECLRGYAVSFADGIKTRRIVFHPTGALLHHGCRV